jgi:hypothetical protein
VSADLVPWCASWGSVRIRPKLDKPARDAIMGSLRTSPVRRARRDVSATLAGSSITISGPPEVAALEDGGPVVGSPYLAIPLGVRREESPLLDRSLRAVRIRGRVFLINSGGERRWLLVRRTLAPALRGVLRALDKATDKVADTLAAQVERGLP